MKKAAIIFIAVSLGIVFVFLGTSLAQGQKRETPPPPVSFPDAKNQIQLSGYLYQPEGPGPFPSIVLLHGCAGIRPKHHWWARQLRHWGYTALIVDSLGPRNIPDVCDDPSLNDKIGPYVRTFDAYGAWHYLRRQSFVDQDRMGIIGWSHGGVAVLTAFNKLLVDVLELPQNAFRAAIAWYPLCFGTGFTTPLLVLIGERDDWTPARHCTQMLRDLESDSAPVSLKIYPAAYHSFDRLASGPMTYRGHHLERHAQAVSEAKAEIKQFLARYLSADVHKD
jgi:dienelactone hydrolase